VVSKVRRTSDLCDLWRVAGPDNPPLRDDPVSVVVRPTNDAGGVGNEVPEGPCTCEEVRGSTVCKASSSSEMSSPCEVSSDRGVDEPGEEVTATVGDIAPSGIGWAVECSSVYSAAEGAPDWSLECGSGRHSRLDC